MEKVTRKLQKISGSFFISLPKPWVDHLGLEKNAAIEIGICGDGSLKLCPQLRHEDVENEISLKCHRYVARDVVKNALSGIERILVRSDDVISEEIASDLAWFVKRLPHTEIIDEAAKTITIQNFGYKSIPTKQAIQRLLYLACDMFEILREGGSSGSLEDAVPALDQKFEDLRRFYFIVVAHIRTYLRTGLYASQDKSFTPLQAMDYRMFCEKIERIGIILRKMRPGTLILPFLERVEKLYNDVLNAFLKNDSVGASKIWERRKSLLAELEEEGTKLVGDKKEKMGALAQVVEYCKDMADLI